MFAYCGNNPVNRTDNFGFLWSDIKNTIKRIGASVTIVGALLTSNWAVILGKERHYSRNDNNTTIIETIDMGTYNFGTNFISHWYLDIVPWVLWGNSREDSSSVWDRAYSLVWGNT